MRIVPVVLLLALAVSGISYAQGVHPLTGRRIAGVATDAAWLDRPERTEEESPEQALELIGIRRGMVVADVGAGTGYFTFRLAQRVGPTGKVYANDLQPTMLARLKDRLQEQKITNVEIVQGAVDDARLPAGALDLAILVDVYHEFSRPQEMLRSLKAVLKPTGRLVLLEYRKEDPTIPINPDHKMSVADAQKELGAEGFRLDRLIRALPRQHILVFRIAER